MPAEILEGARAYSGRWRHTTRVHLFLTYILLLQDACFLLQHDTQMNITLSLVSAIGYRARGSRYVFVGHAESGAKSQEYYSLCGSEIVQGVK